MKNNKKYFVEIGLLCTFMVVIAIGNRLLVDKITEKVIQKLQKKYSPSPYGPGFDPDKLDLEKIKNLPVKPVQEKVVPPKAVPQKTQYEESWEDRWENSRKN